MKFIEKSYIALCFVLLTLSCSGGPVVTYDPVEYGAGEMAPVEHRSIWVKISNSGGSELTVENVRPLCDCITVDSIPESVQPGETDSLKVTYVAPDSAGPDQSSLMIRTDGEPKNQKITITSEVLPVKISNEDSTIAIIPFQAPGVPNGQQVALELFEHLLKELPKRFEPVNPNELSRKIVEDPNYNVEPLHIVARKWANLLGIRYVVVGEFKPVDREGNHNLAVMLIDGMFHLPVGKKASGLKLEEIPAVAADTLNSILEHIPELEKQAMMADFQRKWAEQRAKLMNKPAPPIEAKDIRTGEEIALSDYRGKPLILQFFSTDCDHCEEEMDWLSGLITEHPEIAAVGISVNVGQIDSVKQYIKGRDLPYPVILPTEEKEAQLDPYYGGATPQTVIISPEGVVVQSLVGFSEGATRSFEKMLLQMAEAGRGTEHTPPSGE